MRKDVAEYDTRAIKWENVPALLLYVAFAFIGVSIFRYFMHH